MSNVKINSKLFKEKGLISDTNFFQILEPIALTQGEYDLRKEIICNYAKAKSFTVVQILASDYRSTVAKAIDLTGENLIIKYYHEEEDFQQEIVGLYCLESSRVAELLNVSLDERIIEIKFYPGCSIVEIINIDSYLVHLAEMHVDGIEKVLNTIEKNEKNSGNMFLRYYDFCALNSISTNGEFIIGDHNPDNYLVNENGSIIRIDLGTFRLQQPILLDVYLFLYHIYDVYKYNEKTNDILYSYYKSFVEYSEKKPIEVRNHMAENFELFKLQINCLAEYIDKDIKNFNQYYLFLKINFEHGNEKFA